MPLTNDFLEEIVGEKKAGTKENGKRNLRTGAVLEKENLLVDDEAAMYFCGKE